MGVCITQAGSQSTGGIVRRGAESIDLFVERPANVELTTTSTTGHSFGLSIPSSLSLRVDEVIQ